MDAQYHFTIGNEIFFVLIGFYFHGGTLYLSICHLGSQSTFPYQFVEFILVGFCWNTRAAHIGRANCFVSFLRPFAFGSEVAHLAILLSKKLYNSIFGSAKSFL